jgi:predicted DNA-binding transcriptional regulator YafY
MNIEKEILEQNGWTVECQSPFEIRHIDGSFATGQAAHLVLQSLEEEFNPAKTIFFDYKNWKGEEGTRKVVPIDIWFGSTQYHPEQQWLLKALDVDKQAERDFALNDIIKFKR